MLNDKIREYAEHFIGKTYEWGGNGSNGFDCSGFVLEVLWAFGIYRGNDTTAKGLYRYFFDKCCKPEESDIILEFYGKDTFNGSPLNNDITHVAIRYNEHQVIEAGGSNGNGMVRLRPSNWRKDHLDTIYLKM